MKNELRISFIGNTAIGKSTILFEVYQHLLDLGFDVELLGMNPNDKENYHEDFSSEESFNKQMFRNREDRIRVVREKTKITLNEMQAYWDVKETDVKPEDTWKTKAKVDNDN